MGGRKKLVTVEDYRLDRDYWMRRATKQQGVINSFERHNYRLQNEVNSCKSALEHFRDALQDVCLHEEVATYPGGTKFCKLCTASVEEER